MTFYPNLSFYRLPKPYLLSITEAKTMIVFAAFAFVFAFPSTVVVSALTQNNPSLILAGSATANLTNSNYIHKCSGTEYGYDLDSASCADAVSQIDASSTIEQTYGPRFEGPFDVKLPKRYISCSFSPSLYKRMLLWANDPFFVDSEWALYHRAAHRTWGTLRSCKFAGSRLRSQLCH